MPKHPLESANTLNRLTALHTRFRASAFLPLTRLMSIPPEGNHHMGSLRQEW